MGNPKSICIFGDSISYGAGDTEMGGWANRLWLYVSNREGGDYTELYNCSITGGTTETILARFEAEAKIRNNVRGLIFQTGENDSAYEHTPNNYIVAPERFENNIKEIIQRAKIITPNIMFMCLANCDESKTMPVSWADVYCANENIQKYNDIVKRICAEQGVLFLNIMPLANDDFEDGLHPNAMGHEKIYIQVRDCLVQHSWI